MSESSDIVVLGVGNLLRSDEGVGVHAARQLAAGALPDGVDVIDAGVAVADALSAYKSIGKLIVVDAVDAKAQPGSVFRFRPRDVQRRQALLRSLHELDLFDALDLARHGGCTVGEVIVVGVQPKTVDWGLELSPEVQARLPDVVNLVAAELSPPTEEAK